MSKAPSIDIRDPDLFDKYPPGEYSYGSNGYGKYACGTLQISDDPKRDPKAQAAAGGEARRGKDSKYGIDDGGHLIAAYFGGAPGEENLTAQDRNLNRSTYKAMEHNWAEHVKNGDKVFVYVETDRADRPTAYMGYVVYEDANGRRDVDYFHMINESQAEIASWEEAAAEAERNDPTLAELYSETEAGISDALDSGSDRSAGME